MKIAILGAGFTGLSAAYQLTKKGYQVTVLEKNAQPGGLATGFKEKNWDWSLEKHYHHFFTNDSELFSLAQEIGLFSSLIYPKSLTSLYLNGKIYPFNTPGDILTFKLLNPLNRLRLGLATVLLKLLPEIVGIKLERYTAFGFAQTIFGKEIFQLIWQPLLESKFGVYSDKVNAGWLWARIKKRTLQLGYIAGGFQTLADKLAEKIQQQGGKLYFNTEIRQIRQENNKWKIHLTHPSPDRRGSTEGEVVFDAVISNLPTPIFLKLVPDLPKNIVQQLSSIPHLHALNLVLETQELFLKNTYWLNINEREYPFLCVVQHTNFIDKINYGGNHLLYVSNYLPKDHPYFKKSANELLKIYEPYLKKINPKYSFQVSGVRCQVFTGPFAQPVFTTNYSHIRPYGEVRPGLYFANLDSVYPWDRGTNYALEIGRKMAEVISNSKNLK